MNMRLTVFGRKLFPFLSKEKEMIRLGDKVRDSLTGYTGTVIARTEWLHGCVRLTVQANELKDGKPVASHTFDEPQAELVEESLKPAAKPSGGPTPEPSRHSDPAR